MAASVPLGIKTHAQRVCSLYKKALRNLEAFYDRRIFRISTKILHFDLIPTPCNVPESNVYRYHAVLLRERFDKHAKEQDMRVAVDLVKKGEEELFMNQHPIPRAFAFSPGGVAHERVVTPPDWVLDYWHPLEKAQYPEYFKLREQRKLEYIAMWEKQYGKHDPKDDHH